MAFIELVRWVLAVPLLLVFLFFAVMNFKALVDTVRTNLNTGTAPVTVVGGLAGCLGLVIVPYADLGSRLAYLWVPLMLDLGCGPFYLSMLVVAVWQFVNAKAWQRYFRRS